MRFLSFTSIQILWVQELNTSTLCYITSMNYPKKERNMYYIVLL